MGGFIRKPKSKQEYEKKRRKMIYQFLFFKYPTTNFSESQARVLQLLPIRFLPRNKKKERKVSAGDSMPNSGKISRRGTHTCLMRCLGDSCDRVLSSRTLRKAPLRFGILTLYYARKGRTMYTNSLCRSRIRMSEVHEYLSGTRTNN